MTFNVKHSVYSKKCHVCVSGLLTTGLVDQTEGDPRGRKTAAHHYYYLSSRIYYSPIQVEVPAVGITSSVWVTWSTITVISIV